MDFLFEIFIKNQNLLYILIYDNINDYLIEWKNNYDEYIKTEIDEKMRKFTNFIYYKQELTIIHFCIKKFVKIIKLIYFEKI